METGLCHEHMLSKIFFLNKLHSVLEYRWAIGLGVLLQNLSIWNTLSGQNEWHISLHCRESLDSKLNYHFRTADAWDESSVLCAFLGGFAPSHQSSGNCSGSMEERRIGLLVRTVLGGIFGKQSKLQLDQTKVWKYNFSFAEYVFVY